MERSKNQRNERISRMSVYLLYNIAMAANTYRPSFWHPPGATDVVGGERVSRLRGDGGRPLGTRPSRDQEHATPGDHPGRGGQTEQQRSAANGETQKGANCDRLTTLARLRTGGGRRKRQRISCRLGGRNSSRFIQLSYALSYTGRQRCLSEDRVMSDQSY